MVRDLCEENYSVWSKNF